VQKIAALHLLKWATGISPLFYPLEAGEAKFFFWRGLTGAGQCWTTALVKQPVDSTTAVEVEAVPLGGRGAWGLCAGAGAPSLVQGQRLRRAARQSVRGRIVGQRAVPLRGAAWRNWSEAAQACSQGSRGSAAACAAGGQVRAVNYFKMARI
jgi:hypothetical protein